MKDLEAAGNIRSSDLEVVVPQSIPETGYAFPHIIGEEVCLDHWDYARG